MIYLEKLLKQPIQKVVAYDIEMHKLFAYIKDVYTDCYFFESLANARQQDRYYCIGFAPRLIFTAKQNIVTISGPDTYEFTGMTECIVNCDNPYDYLSEIKLNFKGTFHMGGLIGYCSYEAVNYFEKLNLPEHSDFDTFKFGLYTDGLIYDTVTGTLTYYSYDIDRSINVLDIIEKHTTYKITPVKSVEFKGNSVTKEQFIQYVDNTKEKIKNGFSFQSEVGFKAFYDIDGDKYNVYLKLREVNPSPYMYYIKFDDVELLGASPEVLITCKNRLVLTTPAAGTIKRCLTDALEDVRLARELLTDPKEVSEHNMLVDLHRNDISRVCEPGSVKVAELMYVIKFSHVQHIVSDIVGTLQYDKDAYDVLKCILPGGVVTGAPKIETIKIIHANEGSPRGPYGGAVGRVAMNGDCNFCLPIRSLFCKGNKCFAQTSAGVVFDSIPEKEYTEVLNKLAAMKYTLENLETL